MAIKIDELYRCVGDPPNDAQRGAIETIEGPMRIIAGPGSGKTHALILRTLNLIACQGVHPSRIVIVTFTEKAATELTERVRLYANRLPEVPKHIAELKVGTIHWFCGSVLREYHPDLRRFEPLDDLGQRLFVRRRLDAICDGLTNERSYLGKWNSKSRAVTGLIPWFNKVTEEVITPDTLRTQPDAFSQMLGTAYERYQEALWESGYLDFSFILRALYDLFDQRPEVLERARAEFDYFMIDEYQDTNFVQEEILLRLAAPRHNIAVVGDDDQSLYRFRGATVRNILEFADRHRKMGNEITESALEINYRSHPSIIRTYADFMNDGSWHVHGHDFRIGHAVLPDPDRKFTEYPAAMHLTANAEELASLVKDILDRGMVHDPSQIALLFYSVSGHAQGVINALRDQGVEAYAPRARRFLQHPEVMLSVGVLWALAGFADDNRPMGGPVAQTCSWAEDCARALQDDPKYHRLARWLELQRARIDKLREGEDISAALLDMLYQSLRFEPFRSLLKDPVAARNLAHVTVLLRTLQQQYSLDVIHAGNRNVLPWVLWATFFYMLQTSGVDDVESDDAAPAGMVQVMTIHQAKGLEFPVVIVGSLEKQPSVGKEIDRTLGPLYKRGPFEPESHVTEFDRRRLFYVALSRAKHLLVTFSDGSPHKYFDGLVSRLPSARHADWKHLAREMPREAVKEAQHKPTFSLTGQISVYRRCKRQYELFNEYGFVPSFAAQIFFGTVVHQTIEDIHHYALEGRQSELSTQVVRGLFDRNSELLRKRGIHPLAPSQRDEAFEHVARYLRLNRNNLHNVIETEIEVMLEKPDYVLDGRVDLVRGVDDKVEMVDFKAQKRVANDSDEFAHYQNQLALYWHLLEEKYGKKPDRAILYFTGERDLDQARVRVDLSRSDIDHVVAHFDETAQCILDKQYEMKPNDFPPQDTCRACDFQHYCRRGDADREAA